MKIFTKIKFLFRKPKVIIIFGKEKKELKKVLFEIFKNYFKIDKDLFIFEAEEKEIDKFYFFLKNSRLPILAAIKAEESSLFKKMPSKAYFLLRDESEKIKKNVAGRADFRIIKLGFGQKSDIFISDIKINSGTSFKVNHKGSTVPFWFKKRLDQEEINVILFAIGAGVVLGLNLVEMSQSFKLLDGSY